ncbi:Lacal_2735 family protein [Mangrovimonas sp. YM274]|uniref:Lacal_2735 family protein n=1 Tax=Mangrovimonas sp. YM274 TaxID=3070660 RepID=UPI0027DDCB2A|nr:Lacal_2735 family protein [Mangrovimonas sp. YM274]WMI67906.1 Lacal_2735 family protein [Mangrovimonas sp. YM274]
MKTSSELKSYQQKLLTKYKELIEQAYNLRQTDSALSDISEYKAIKLLNKLNRLKYLSRERELSQHPTPPAPLS